MKVRKSLQQGREALFSSPLPGCMAHMVIELWENLAAQTGVTAPNLQTHFLIAS